jgi:UDP-3-O-[3-hydroxymyristoyl] N-acetylglucosamine deacetylase
MQRERFQQTIAHVAHVSGRGYWSGSPITLTFLPAQADQGIVFRRTDLPGRPVIPATAAHRRETSLRTTLFAGGHYVEMIEHVMAALYGLQIDNCIVECDAPEMPGMDGSALAYMIALERAGVQTQSAVAKEVSISTTIRVGDDRKWVMAIPSMDPGLTIQYQLDFGPASPIPATSTFAIEPETFARSIAPARTFLSEADARSVQLQGVASHVTHRDLLIFGSDGPIDNSLRFTDECSRHKLLDVVGDIALSGLRIQGKLIACRSGHILNGRMAEAIRNLKESQVLQQTRRAA